MGPILFPASYGGVSFWFGSFDGQGGRDIVVQSPSRGDIHVLQDRGRRHRTLSSEIMFVDEPDRDPVADRFRAFLDLSEDGEGHLFTHPILGSYLARVSDLSYSVRSDDAAITATCTFHAESEPQPILPAGAGAAPMAGLEEVTATVARAESELSAQGLPSDAPASVLAKVEGWVTAEDPDARAIYLELASASEMIDREIDRLDLLTNLDRWPVYREMIHLQYQMSRAAEAVTSDVSDVIEVTISASIPLRLLCADLYGADAADDRAHRVAQINRLRTPGLVPAGTLLKVPREGARDGS